MSLVVQRRRVLELLLALAVVGGLAWVVLASPALAVEKVAVTGTGRVSEAQVLAAAAVAPGTPLARVDVEAVQRRVGALAPVDRVEVVRGWPSTLRLRVVERQVAVGVLTAGRVRLLDDEGVPFASADRLPADTVHLQVPRPGPGDPTTRDALAVLAEVPPDLRSRVAIVRAAAPGAVSLLLKDGRQVLWGAPGRAGDKAAAATALLRLPGTVYDVTRPGVVVRRQAVDPAQSPGVNAVDEG